LLRDAKVGDLDDAVVVGVNEDVVALEVAMEDASAVEVGETVEDLTREPPHFGLLELAVLAEDTPEGAWQDKEGRASTAATKSASTDRHGRLPAHLRGRIRGRSR
jgi:hypothetical protein